MPLSTQGSRTIPKVSCITFERRWRWSGKEDGVKCEQEIKRRGEKKNIYGGEKGGEAGRTHGRKIVREK